MEKHNDEIHVSEVEASGGSKEGVGRWVLLIGTLLAILLLSVVWIVPALTRSDMEQEATVSGEIRAREDSEAIGSSTDSIVGAAEPTPGNETEIGTDEVQQQDGLSTIEN